MKKVLIFSALFLLASVSLSAQVVKGAGLWYFNGLPNVTPSVATGTEVAYSINNKSLFKWNRTTSAWVAVVQDSSITNELQDLILSGDTLSLTLSGSVILMAQYRNHVWEITNLSDTTSITGDIEGDIAYTSTGDTIAFRGASAWLPFTGGGGGGTFNSFNIAGDTGSDIVTDGQTVTIAGGYGINTAETGGTVTVTADTTQLAKLPIEISDVNGLADSLANVRAATIIPIPPAFNYFPPFDILRVAPDSFRVDPAFDLEVYANVTTTDTLYVDISVVSSGTGQSWAQAYKGLDEAITAANSSGTAKLIYVAKGWYPKQHSWNGVVPTVQVKTIGDLTQGTGAAPYLTTDLRDVTGSFSPTSNYYSASLTTEPEGVYDASLADAFGDSQTLTKRSSIALVNSNPGSWHWASNVLYIRTADSRAPDANMRYYDDATNAVINADSSVFYLKNLEFRGKGLIASNASSDGECTVLVENCGSKETIEYAVSANGITLLLFGGTWAKSDSTDLLNYHSANTVIPSVIEYNLTVYNSAELHTGCGNCQASTGHDGAEIIRINGDYSYSSGQTIADVSGTNTWCLGTNVHDSRTGIGFYFGSAGTAANYFLLDCVSESTVDIRSEADATIRYRNFTPDPPVVDGAGSFHSHYTYNSDGLATLPGGLISGLTDNYVPRALGTDDLENSQIFDNGTDIGIFTNSPEADVHIRRNDVTGSISSSAAHLAIEDSAQDPTFTFFTTRTRASNFGFRDEYQPLGGIVYYSTNHATLPNRLSFFTRNSGTTTAKATIDSTGRMGLGIQAPEKLLHLFVNNVVQTAQSDVNILVEKGSDDVAFQFLTGVSRRGTFFWGDATNTALGFIRYDMSSGSVANNMFFGTAGSNRWQINASGAWLASTDNSWDIGASGATRPRTGYFGTSVLAPLVNAATGFQVGGAATSGSYLRGNGTNIVLSTIQAGDIPDLSATYLRQGANALTQNTTINGVFDLKIGNTSALDTVSLTAKAIANTATDNITNTADTTHTVGHVRVTGNVGIGDITNGDGITIAAYAAGNILTSVTIDGTGNSGLLFDDGALTLSNNISEVADTITRTLGTGQQIYANGYAAYSGSGFSYASGRITNASGASRICKIRYYFTAETAGVLTDALTVRVMIWDGATYTEHRAGRLTLTLMDDWELTGAKETIITLPDGDGVNIAFDSTDGLDVSNFGYVIEKI